MKNKAGRISSSGFLFYPIANFGFVEAKPILRRKAVGSRVDWKKKTRKKNKSEFFPGIDNAFDATYSLGNDINTAGNRYYNAAGGRNYYCALAIGLF